MKKYEFTDETWIIDGAVLRRIRAVRDIPEVGVRVGILGGFLQAERNLSQDGPAWVHGDACVMGSALVEGRAFVSGQATVKGGAAVGGSAVVVGPGVVVTGSAYVGGSARIREYAQIYGAVSVVGTAAIGGRAKVHGAGSIKGNECIGFNADVGSTRDWLHIGPAKSSGRYVTAYRDTELGVRVQTGCFTGTVKAFSKAIEETHQHNQETLHQYRLICQLIAFNFEVQG